MIGEENLENIENVELFDDGFDNQFDIDEQVLMEEPIVSEKSEQDIEFEDDTFNDIDFSDFKGDFKQGLKKISRHVDKKSAKRSLKRSSKKPLRKPLNKRVSVEKGARITSKGKDRPISRVLVPRDRKVIVEGVDRFMLSQDPCDVAVKGIGYYKCKKLKSMVFTFNNNSALDFNLELFNPSAPLDYLYSTSQNINNKISVAGDGVTQYTDVLYNMLANPAIIYNARIVVSGDVAGQQAQSLIFKNKNVMGEQKVAPLQVSLNLDNMQVQNSVINFDIIGSLNRPFIPDGMDVIQYKILAGNTVTLAFFFEQKQIKDMYYQEARESKKLL